MERKIYKCIFFDLDHTLWDYETNSCEALRELYSQYKLDELGCAEFNHFYEGFVKINTEIWDRYDRGEIGKDVIRFERFHRVLQFAGINNYELSLRFSKEYIAESPKKKNLVPFAKDLLEYLKVKYQMFIITNGFDEIQSTKLKASGIEDYFKSMITSSRAGHKKPSKEIFEFALKENGFLNTEAIMIGDNLLTDIAGAKNAAIDHVYYNPNRVAHQEALTHEISSLKELTLIL